MTDTFDRDKKLDALKRMIPKEPEAKIKIADLLDGAAQVGYKTAVHDIVQVLRTVYDASSREQHELRSVLKTILTRLERLSS
jgi:hypothetical protein